MKKAVLIFALVLITAMLFIGCENEYPQPCTDSTHTWKVLEKEDATCTSKGFISAKCEVCGKEKAEVLPMLEHTLAEGSRICSVCERAIYKSLEDFNANATLKDTKDVVNEISLSKGYEYSDINYTPISGAYTGKGLLIGRTDNEPLNYYGAKPAAVGDYTFIFKDGTITSAATSYKNIDNIKDAFIYMLIPGNSKVTFENVTFNGVIAFGNQPYTNPWSYLDSLTFQDCTFNAMVVCHSPAENVTFDGCTFNNYENNYEGEESNANPIWLRSSIGSYQGDQTQYNVSMENVVFTNNTVRSSRPVKFERIGQNSDGLNYQPTLKILDNTFDMSYPNVADKPNEDKHIALYLGPEFTDKHKDGIFTLYDDGNVVNDGYALYTVPENYEASKVAGTKILDRNGKEKEIKARVWKSLTDEVTL